MSMFKRWLAGRSSPETFTPGESKSGCRMNAARKVMHEERARLVARIDELGPWFHNYEIASDVWTNPSGRPPGAEYPLARWSLIEPLLPDVKGKSCLDVACSSGFFSLKLKELGAAYVLGVDSGEQPNAIDQARFAATTLGLDVDFRVLSAYDLATLGREFDVVLFMGLFYHLRHPLVALEAARAVCRGTMIFQTVTTKHQHRFPEPAPAINNVPLRSSPLEASDFPSLRFVEGALDGDTSCWFVPNLQALAAILRSCNFRVDQAAFANDHDVVVRCGTRAL
jgi:tRNA (mo5U34)-methyltransferase